MTPPTIAERIVAGVISDNMLEQEVLGDLAERWAQYAGEDGARNADRWYWREALRTTPYLLLSTWRRSARRDARRTAGGVLVGFITLAFSSSLGGVVVAGIFGAGMSRSSGATATGAVIDFVGGLASGAAAARMSKRAPLMTAVVFAGAYVALAIVAALLGGSAPLGYWTSLLAIVPGAVAIIGGSRRRGSSASAEVPDPVAPR